MSDSIDVAFSDYGGNYQPLSLVGGGTSTLIVPCGVCARPTMRYEQRAEANGTVHTLHYCPEHSAREVTAAWRAFFLDRVAPVVTSGTRQYAVTFAPGSPEETMMGLAKARLACAVCLHEGSASWLTKETNSLRTAPMRLVRTQHWQTRRLRDGTIRFMAWCTIHTESAVNQTWLNMLVAGGPARDPAYINPSSLPPLREDWMGSRKTWKPTPPLAGPYVPGGSGATQANTLQRLASWTRNQTPGRGRQW